MPTRVNSSTTYCTTGLRPTGSISLGCDLVAGSRRVPRPATGTTATSMSMRVRVTLSRDVSFRERRSSLHYDDHRHQPLQDVVAAVHRDLRTVAPRSLSLLSVPHP